MANNVVKVLTETLGFTDKKLIKERHLTFTEILGFVDTKLRKKKIFRVFEEIMSFVDKIVGDAPPHHYDKPDEEVRINNPEEE